VFHSLTHDTHTHMLTHNRTQDTLEGGIVVFAEEVKSNVFDNDKLSIVFKGISLAAKDPLLQGVSLHEARSQYSHVDPLFPGFSQTYMYMYIHTCTYMYICACVCIYMYTYYIYIYIYIHMFMYIFMCACVHIYMYKIPRSGDDRIQKYICIYIYICIYL